MSFYDDMQAVATSVLQQFTQGTVTLVKMVPGSGPAENPGPATPVETVIPGAAVRGVSLNFVQKGLAQASDLQVTAQVMTTRAALSDTLKIDGKVYKFRQIIQIPAAGTPVAFTYIIHQGG